MNVVEKQSEKPILTSLLDRMEKELCLREDYQFSIKDRLRAIHNPATVRENDSAVAEGLPRAEEPASCELHRLSMLIDRLESGNSRDQKALKTLQEIIG